MIAVVNSPTRIVILLASTAAARSRYGHSFMRNARTPPAVFGQSPRLLSAWGHAVGAPPHLGQLFVSRAMQIRHVLRIILDALDRRSRIVAERVKAGREGRESLCPLSTRGAVDRVKA